MECGRGAAVSTGSAPSHLARKPLSSHDSSAAMFTNLKSQLNGTMSAMHSAMKMAQQEIATLQEYRAQKALVQTNIAATLQDQAICSESLQATKTEMQAYLSVMQTANESRVQLQRIVDALVIVASNYQKLNAAALEQINSGSSNVSRTLGKSESLLRTFEKLHDMHNVAMNQFAMFKEDWLSHNVRHESAVSTMQQLTADHEFVAAQVHELRAKLSAVQHSTEGLVQQAAHEEQQKQALQEQISGLQQLSPEMEDALSCLRAHEATIFDLKSEIVRLGDRHDAAIQAHSKLSAEAADLQSSTDAVKADLLSVEAQMQHDKSREIAYQEQCERSQRELHELMRTVQETATAADAKKAATAQLLFDYASQLHAVHMQTAAGQVAEEQLDAELHTHSQQAQEDELQAVASEEVMNRRRLELHRVHMKAEDDRSAVVQLQVRVADQGAALETAQATVNRLVAEDRLRKQEAVAKQAAAAVMEDNAETIAAMDRAYEKRVKRMETLLLSKLHHLNDQIAKVKARADVAVAAAPAVEASGQPVVTAPVPTAVTSASAAEVVVGAEPEPAPAVATSQPAVVVVAPAPAVVISPPEACLTTPSLPTATTPLRRSTRRAKGSMEEDIGTPVTSATKAMQRLRLKAAVAAPPPASSAQAFMGELTSPVSVATKAHPQRSPKKAAVPAPAPASSAQAELTSPVPVSRKAQSSPMMAAVAAPAPTVAELTSPEPVSRKVLSPPRKAAVPSPQGIDLLDQEWLTPCAAGGVPPKLGTPRPAAPRRYGGKKSTHLATPTLASLTSRHLAEVTPNRSAGGVRAAVNCSIRRSKPRALATVSETSKPAGVDAFWLDDSAFAL